MEGKIRQTRPTGKNPPVPLAAKRQVKRFPRPPDRKRNGDREK